MKPIQYIISLKLNSYQGIEISMRFKNNINLNAQEDTICAGIFSILKNKEFLRHPETFQNYNTFNQKRLIR